MKDQVVVSRTGFFCFYDDRGDLKVLGATSVPLTMNNFIGQEVVMHRHLAVGKGAVPGYPFNGNVLIMTGRIIRLFFDDTSNSSSFPKEDWSLVVNGPEEGSGEYFAIYDSTAQSYPFVGL